MRLTNSKYKDFRGGWTICYWSGLISSHKRTKTKKKLLTQVLEVICYLPKGTKNGGSQKCRMVAFGTITKKVRNEKQAKMKNDVNFFSALTHVD